MRNTSGTARAHGAPAALVAGVLLVLAAAGCTSSSTTGSTTGTGGSSTTAAPGTSAAPGTTAGPGSPGFNDPTDPFYVAPSPLPKGDPGTVIRQEAFAGAPAGAQAWRVLYHSTALDGSDTAVSGIVIAPTGPAPAGGRPVLSWAHPTTGVVDSCAPSTSPLFWELLPGLQAFLSAGYAIAATDYEGLGTAGVHPYLIGVSEGRSVLDAARAARSITDAGAGTKLLLWGHSQGGQASLFAGQLAPTYAPDLDLVGVAAAAPAGELAALLELQQDTTTGVVLGGYAMNAFHDIYGPTTPGLRLEQVVTSAGRQVIPEIVALCDLTQSTQLEAVVTPVVGGFYEPGAGSQAPWKPLLDENSPGRERTAAPVLITQGTADQVVIPTTTEDLATGMCRLGDQLELKLYDGVPHDTIGYASAADVATWLAARLQGTAPTVTCGADLPALPPGTAPGTTAP